MFALSAAYFKITFVQRIRSADTIYIVTFIINSTVINISVTCENASLCYRDKLRRKVSNYEH